MLNRAKRVFGVVGVSYFPFFFSKIRRSVKKKSNTLKSSLHLSNERFDESLGNQPSGVAALLSGIRFLLEWRVSVHYNGGMEEVTLWQGARSQITNWGVYAIALLLIAGAIVGGFFFSPVWALIAVPVIWIVWVWLQTRSESFTLTTERLRLKRGVLNQVFDEVELYRVKDVTLTRSAIQRMFGLGTVTMMTSDHGQENICIDSVHSSEELREQLRKQVEIIRDRKRVREVDFQEDILHE